MKLSAKERRGHDEAALSQEGRWEAGKAPAMLRSQGPRSLPIRKIGSAYTNANRSFTAPPETRFRPWKNG